MARWSVLGAAALLMAVSGQPYAAEPLKSGPQVGSMNDCDGFFPKWATTPIAGKRLCPV